MKIKFDSNDDGLPLGKILSISNMFSEINTNIIPKFIYIAVNMNESMNYKRCA